MPEPAGPYDFVYVHTDIPDGMTIREWRAQRAASSGRERQRRRHAQRCLGAAASRGRGVARAVGASAGLADRGATLVRRAWQHLAHERTYVRNGGWSHHRR